MAEIKKQEVKSGREQLLERAAKHFPERRFNGQIGQDGQIVQDGTDDLEQAIIEMFNESDARIQENQDKNKALIDLMCSDPRCQEFVTKWIESGDPRAALVEAFGDDLAGLATEEGRGEFKEQLKSWRERKAENDKMNAEAEANWQASLDALEKWGNEHGLDNDRKAQIMGRLMTITGNGLMNKYLPEDFDMVLKDTDFDNAVQAARRDGEIAGRNEKIKAERRTRDVMAGMPPSMPGGQGMRVAEKKESEEKSPWAGLK